MANEGVLAAVGTVAAGAALLYGTDTFKDVPCETIKFEGDKSKLTDGSAYMRAQAMADYACKYFNAVKTNAKTNTIIALIQQASAFYIADKRHDVAKQAQNRFDEIWHDQKDKSNKFFSHWYDHSRPIELEALQEARERERAGYQVDYETAINRSTARSRAEFSRAREKIARETPIHCVGARRSAIRQLHIAEARTAVLATNSAIRFEEERKHQRETQYRQELMQWTQFFQGNIGYSNRALAMAQQATASMNAIDPYAGWTSSLSLMNNFGSELGKANMASFQAGNSHPAMFAGGFF